MRTEEFAYCKYILYRVVQTSKIRRNIKRQLFIEVFYRVYIILLKSQAQNSITFLEGKFGKNKALCRCFVTALKYQKSLGVCAYGNTSEITS